MDDAIPDLKAHAVNTPVLVAGPDWPWGDLGSPVRIPEPPGPFRTKDDREEQLWWICAEANAQALVRFYAFDLKQRQRAMTIVSLAACETERVFGSSTSRAIGTLARKAAQAYTEEVTEGIETILLAQTLLAIRVLRKAYVNCQVKGAGRRMVERMNTVAEQAISCALPAEIAAEVISMKAAQ